MPWPGWSKPVRATARCPTARSCGHWTRRRHEHARTPPRPRPRRPRPGPGAGDRPGLRHAGGPVADAAPRRARRHQLPLLQPALPRTLRRRPTTLPGTAPRCARGSAARHRVHLPDASGRGAGRPRHLPQVRHGARARAPHRGRGREPRTDRLPPPLPVDLAAVRGSAGAGHGRGMAATGRRRPYLAAAVARHSGGALAGWPFFQRWAQSIANRSPNMWTLIGTGVMAAYGYSLVATFAPGLFPAEFHEHGRVGVYYEAAAVVVSLTLPGQLLELKARAASSGALRALR